MFFLAGRDGVALNFIFFTYFLIIYTLVCNILFYSFYFINFIRALAIAVIWGFGHGEHVSVKEF